MTATEQAVTPLQQRQAKGWADRQPYTVTVVDTYRVHLFKELDPEGARCSAPDVMHDYEGDGIEAERVSRTAGEAVPDSSWITLDALFFHATVEWERWKDRNSGVDLLGDEAAHVLSDIALGVIPQDDQALLRLAADERVWSLECESVPIESSVPEQIRIALSELVSRHIDPDDSTDAVREEGDTTSG